MAIGILLHDRSEGNDIPRLKKYIDKSEHNMGFSQEEEKGIFLISGMIAGGGFDPNDCFSEKIYKYRHLSSPNRHAFTVCLRETREDHGRSYNHGL